MPYKTGLNINFFEASAIIGLNIGNTGKSLGVVDVEFAIKKVSEAIDYVFSGTITPAKILVAGKNKNYEENAVLVWTSVYPRFPVEKEKFKSDFTNFIGELLSALRQDRTSINFTDECMMIETEHCKNPDLK
ncbi:MAG: hypothetical protein Q8Q30_00230 [Candidatus Woesebacteria bacterium]|nr:hypothetical protein [Candidatus Woesebacteria bacterium]